MGWTTWGLVCGRGKRFLCSSVDSQPSVDWVEGSGGLWGFLMVGLGLDYCVINKKCIV